VGEILVEIHDAHGSSNQEKQTKIGSRAALQEKRFA
jgi:hypothetical protein